MIKQEWVNREEIKIDREKRTRKRLNETLDFIKLLSLLVVVFFYTISLKSDEIALDLSTINFESVILDDLRMFGEDGIWFKCRKCQVCQWQSSCKADWRGDYYCVRCGEKY